MMARPREFEPTEALQRAMMLFWEKGYEDTSMADLVEATGVSRYGFYTEFGAKHDLYLKCVDHYADTTINSALSPMERPSASLPEIRGYFSQFLLAMDSEAPNMGCLIGNTAMSQPVLDDALDARITRHFTRMRAAFRNALQNAVQQGDLSVDEDAEVLADYLVGVATGYLACLRSMESDGVRRYLQVALARVNISM